ncbi:MAG TPA: RNA polymerase sigma factor [Blastocatellia bacterium]|nr:RNA polymerase sigma factor [Blastocatellia bacterium]
MAKRQIESRLQKFESEALIHADSLLKTSRRVARSSEDAEDVVQETFLRAWKYFDSFEAGSNARAWLFRIMFNVINARVGKQAKLAEVPIESDEGGTQEPRNVVAFDPLRQLEGQEVLEAAKRLSTEHQSVLWLVVIEEFSYQQAAEILEVPTGTIMSRLHRARRELRKLMMNKRAEGTGA